MLFMLQGNATGDTVPLSNGYLDLGSFSLSEKKWSVTGNMNKISTNAENDHWHGFTSYAQSISPYSGKQDPSQLSIDIKRQLISRAANTYLAMGVGWEDIALGGDTSTQGMRFVAEGRVGLYGPTYVFGQAALAPWMSDVAGYIDPFGKEIELGIGIQPIPSMSFRAGYRSYWLDLSNPGNDELLRNQSDGFYIGGGLNW
jgi:hypothetical protein